MNKSEVQKAIRFPDFSNNCTMFTLLDVLIPARCSLVLTQDNAYICYFNEK